MMKTSPCQAMKLATHGAWFGSPSRCACEGVLDNVLNLCCLGPPHSVRKSTCRLHMWCLAPWVDAVAGPQKNLVGAQPCQCFSFGFPFPRPVVPFPFPCPFAFPFCWCGVFAVVGQCVAWVSGDDVAPKRPSVVAVQQGGFWRRCCARMPRSCGHAPSPKCLFKCGLCITS